MRGPDAEKISGPLMKNNICCQINTYVYCAECDRKLCMDCYRKLKWKIDCNHNKAYYNLKDEYDD